MSELLDHLTAGVARIDDGDIANALAHLQHCIQLDSQQCDVWIAVGAAQGVDRALLGKLAATRRTYNHCFSQIPDKYGQIITRRDPYFPLGFAGLRASVLGRDWIALSAAAADVQSGKFADAAAQLSVLAAGGEGITADQVRIMQAWMHHCAGRFTDVLTMAAPLLAGGDDAVTFGHLMTGIAHAHLGRFGAAREHLIAIIPTEAARISPEPAAEAAYWTALTFREEGDDTDCAQYLQRALSLSAEDRFGRALDDPQVRIRLTREELIAARSDPWDITTEPTLKQAQDAEMAARSGDLLAEGLAELDALIGLDDLKEKVRFHCNYMRGLQRRASYGLKVTKSNKHVIFAGPPGTGKTTVAKIFAKIYAGLGIVSTDNLKIASRADFVGEYLGQTSPKTQATLNAALDGVLFIDEAYELVSDTGPGSSDSFGAQAVTEIVAFMEEHRERLVVIIAGYADDIERLLETNEGWRSRFTTRFDFTSYTIDDLIEMARRWCEREEYILPEESAEFIRAKEAALFTQHAESGRLLINRLGNGRFIRTLMEGAAEYAVGGAFEHAELGGDADEAAVQTLTVDAVQRAFSDITRKELKAV